MTYLTWLGVVYLGVMVALALYREQRTWRIRWSRECAAHGVVGSAYIFIDAVLHVLHIMH